jgi:putative aldouronate transport system permease protein
MAVIKDKSIGSRLFDIFILGFMICVVFATLYPFYYMAIVSISDGKAVMRGEIAFYPKGINFETYNLVLKDPAIIRSLANSIYYTLVGTIINLSFTSLCAYPLSRPRFSGRTFFTLMFTVTMFFAGGLIPLYLVVLRLGMMNSIWALVLPTAINTWYMFIMRTFYQGIPESLHESAVIDGANDLVILWRIVLPLAKPIMATLLLFYAVGHWNDFFSPLIYLDEKRKWPMTMILRSLLIIGRMGEATNETLETDFAVVEQTIKYATVMVSTLPILAVYPFVQKYFVKGVMIGAIKG